MTIDDIVLRLDVVRRSSRGYMARCPAHEDRHPSLSVSKGERGILLKCWAGCGLQQITTALGLRVADLFFDQGTDQEQSRLQQRRRVKQRAETANRNADTAIYAGMSCDLAREAEHLLLKLAESDRSAMVDDERDRLLHGVIANAHTVLRLLMGEEAYVEWTCTLGRR